MGRPLIERRLDRRCTAAAMRVVQATMRPGRDVSVVDLSAAGAQIETERPLRPGSRIHIRFVLESGSVAVVAHVVRCCVWALHPEQGPTYRGGLHFDERCARLMEPAYERVTRP
jgi:hypothetical protein